MKAPWVTPSFTGKSASLLHCQLRIAVGETNAIRLVDSFLEYTREAGNYDQQIIANDRAWCKQFPVAHEFGNVAGCAGNDSSLGGLGD